MLISKTINGALRLIGVLAAGEEASPEEHKDGLETLNSLIDSFNTQQLLVSYTQEKVYTPPVGGWKSMVTIGNGIQFDYNETAPIDIYGMWLRDAAGMDYPVRPMTMESWIGMVNKSIVARPSMYIAQFGPDTSVEIQFNTIPYATDEMHIMARMPFKGGYLPTDDINWDYGFERMLRYNLAVELAPEYGVMPSQLVLANAQTSIEDIKQNNYRPLANEVDRALMKRSQYYNNLAGINSGWAW